MGNPAAGLVEKQLRSVFPDDAIARVQVLAYGDEPTVEPGETAIRVFIPRSGRPEGKEADEDIVKAFEEANRALIKELREKLPRFIGWVEFQPDGPGGAARPHGPILRIGVHGGGRAK